MAKEQRKDVELTGGHFVRNEEIERSLSIRYVGTENPEDTIERISAGSDMPIVIKPEQITRMRLEVTVTTTIERPKG